VLAAGEKTAPGQPVPVVDDATRVTSSLDVAGVRLGMTPEQVIAALKGFDSDFVLSKRYVTGFGESSPLAFGQIGDPGSCTAEADFHLLVGIRAAKGGTFRGRVADDPEKKARTVKPDHSGYPECEEDLILQPGSPLETVGVYLSPETGKHRVIGVSFWRSFNPPTAATLVIEAAMKKYSSDVTVKSQTNNSYIWAYDERGRVMSESAAKYEGRLGWFVDSYPTGSELPNSVEKGHGVTLAISVATDSAGMASGFRTSLYDENALYEFNWLAARVRREFDAQSVPKATPDGKPSPIKM
jgi:hypothetical protein